MSTVKNTRQKRVVYLIIEKPKEFASKKEAEKHIAALGGKLNSDVCVYQAKKVDYSIVPMVHIN